VKRLISLTTVAALVCCLAATSVLGKGDSDPKEPSPKSTVPAPETKTKANEKLRADVLKMVADAKNPRAKVPAAQFPQPSSRNNLSTGAKIGIIAGIGGAVFLIWMLAVLNSD